MSKQDKLTLEIAKECFVYDALSGVLKWAERPVSHFSSISSWKSWTSKYAGKEIKHKNHDGYITVGVNGSLFMAHRVIWLLQNNKWPCGEIDHINGNRSDNRVCNLRDVSSSQNQRNTSFHRNNTSGETGVTWDKSKNKWKAQLRSNGKMINLGRFRNLEAAKKARLDGNLKYGYHEGHGKSIMSDFHVEPQ